MKPLFFILLGLAVFGQPANAQINVNINLGAQPQWGPSGYNQADYYYLPDIETYYYVPKKQFIYLNNGQWAFNNSLPSRYSGYNLYNGYKVVLNTPKPYLHFKDHKIKYAKFKGVKGRQASLRSKNSQSKKSNVNYTSTRSSKTYHAGNGNHTKVKLNGGNGKENRNADGQEKGKGKGKGKH
jgi:hypothetical protein